MGPRSHERCRTQSCLPSSRRRSRRSSTPRGGAYSTTPTQFRCSSSSSASWSSSGLLQASLFKMQPAAYASATVPSLRPFEGKRRRALATLLGIWKWSMCLRTAARRHRLRGQTAKRRWPECQRDVPSCQPVKFVPYACDGIIHMTLAETHDVHLCRPHVPPFIHCLGVVV